MGTNVPGLDIGVKRRAGVRGRGLCRYGVAPAPRLLCSMRRERIRMWLVAEQLVAEVDRLLPLVRPAAPNAAEHLERSAESVLFNIGEGVGAWSPKTKIAAYEISKREASELRAILRRFVIKRLLTSQDTRRAYDLAGTAVGMLTNAIKSVQKRLP